MYMFIDSAMIDLIYCVNTYKRIDSSIVSLKAHLSIQVNKCLKIVKYSQVISLQRNFIQIIYADELCLGVYFRFH